MWLNQPIFSSTPNTESITIMKLWNYERIMKCPWLWNPRNDIMTCQFFECKGKLISLFVFDYVQYVMMTSLFNIIILCGKKFEINLKYLNYLYLFVFFRLRHTKPSHFQYSIQRPIASSNYNFTPRFMLNLTL